MAMARPVSTPPPPPRRPRRRRVRAWYTDCQCVVDRAVAPTLVSRPAQCPLYLYSNMSMGRLIEESPHATRGMSYEFQGMNQRSAIIRAPTVLDLQPGTAVHVVQVITVWVFRYPLARLAVQL